MHLLYAKIYLLTIIIELILNITRLFLNIHLLMIKLIFNEQFLISVSVNNIIFVSDIFSTILGQIFLFDLKQFI